MEECGPCPVLASYTLEFALQPRKKHGKTSVRVEYILVRLLVGIINKKIVKIHNSSYGQPLCLLALGVRIPIDVLV